MPARVARPGQRSARLRGLAALAAVLPLALGVLMTGGEVHGQGREIRIEQDFIARAGLDVRPLTVHEPTLDAHLKLLLEREAYASRLEERMAADLTGALDGAGEASAGSVLRAWKRSLATYRALAREAGVPQETLTSFSNDTWSTPALYDACWQVSDHARRLAKERQRLEAAYFDAITQPKGDAATPKPVTFTATTVAGGTAGTTFRITKRFPDLDAGQRKTVLTTLRDRLLDVTRRRQETLEQMLLAVRDASRYGIPIAVAERTVHWATTNTRAVEALEKRKQSVEHSQRAVLAEIEQNERLTEHADKKIAELQEELRGQRPGTPEHAKTRAQLDHVKKERARLEKKLATLRTRRGELKLALAQLTKKIEHAKRVGGRERRTSARYELNRIAARLSYRYTELAIRRRIHDRASDEARHLVKTAKGLHGARIAMAKALRQQAEIAAAAAKAEPGRGWEEVVRAYQPKALAHAYLDLGVVTLLADELKREDGVFAQLHFFTALSDWYKKRKSRVQGSEEGIATLQAFTDELRWYMGLFSGLATTFMEEVKGLTNEADLFHWATELDKVHLRVRRERGGTKKKLDLLKALIDEGVAPGGLRQRLGVGTRTPTPYTYKGPKPTPQQSALELFREDKTFFDALNGGLWRVASAADTTREERLTTEYLIAYTRASLTLRDIKRAEFALKGLDGLQGTWTYKVLFSPFKLLQQAYIAFCEHLLGRPFPVTAWAGQRAAQLALMQSLFEDVRDSGFDESRLAAAKPERILEHRRLHQRHPDYRKLWQTIGEDAHQRLIARCLVALRRERDPQAQARISDRLAALKAAPPSTKGLAFAWVQDGLDLVVQVNYLGAIQSFVKANETDWRVMPTRLVERCESLLAGATAYADVNELAAAIGDRIVWQLVFQGITSRLPGLRKLPAADGSAAQAGAVTAREAAEQTARRSLKDIARGAVNGAIDAGLQAASFTYKFVNPLNSFMSYKLFVDEGVRGVLREMATKAFDDLAQEALRDGVLVGHIGIDPETADFMANLIWEIGDAYYKEAKSKALARAGAYLEQAAIIYYAGQVRMARRRLEELGRGGRTSADAQRVLDDPDAWFWERWVAQRRMLTIAEATTLRERLDDIERRIARALAGAEEGSGAEATLQRHLQDAAAVRSDLYRVFEPEVRERLQDVLTEGDRASRLRSSDPREVMEAAVEVFRGIDYDYIIHHHPVDTPEMESSLRQLDFARQQLLYHSLESVAGRPSGAEGRRARAQALLDEVGMGTVERWQALGLDPVGRLERLLDDIEVIVPTGSAAYDEGGEYVPLKSDLDFTIVLRNADGGVTDHDRAIIQRIVEAKFRRMTQQASPEGDFPGFSHRVFDVSIMVDTSQKFNARLVEASGPDDLLRTLGQADPEQLRSYLAELDRANRDLDLDMQHDERYVTAGRYRALGYLTALGDYIRVFNRTTGRWERRRKSELMSDPEGRQLLMRMRANARLEGWMAFDIMFEDAAFLRMKGKKFSRDEGARVEDLFAYTKELDKRAIRVLLGWLAGTDAGREALNALPDQVMRGEVTADHGTICEVATRILASDPAARARFEAAGIGDPAKLFLAWRDRKLGRVDTDGLVRRQLGLEEGDPTPDPTSDRYRDALRQQITDTEAAVKLMMTDGVDASRREIRPLLQAIVQARDGGGPLGGNPAAVDAAKKKLQHMMKSYVATWKRLGPDERALLEQVMTEAGADFQSFVKQTEEAKEPGFVLKPGYLFKADRDAIERWWEEVYGQ